VPLLDISLGKDWITKSMSMMIAAKINLRIMCDMERVFGTVWCQMISLSFLFLTPRDSSLVTNRFVFKEPFTPAVKLVCMAF